MDAKGESDPTSGENRTTVERKSERELVVTRTFNAPALLRVLLELALENYIKEASVSVHENDKLATRLEKSGLHLLAAGKIGAKQMDVVRKFKQGDKLVSADTLNKYVHSPNFAPSPEHLMSMWDSLADVVVLCLKA